jgi:3-hydroxypropanoate dehydrogenase
MDLLWWQARTCKAWQSRPVSDQQIIELYEVLRMAPTSMNCNAARFVFVRTSEAKEKLAATAFATNQDRIRSAPVVAIVADDLAFYDNLGTLFPHMDIAPMFTGNAELAASTAARNATLQGAYLIMAARSLGLDCGPMSGFDNAAVDAQFFPDSSLRSNFLCCLGYGDRENLHPRLPRLEFDQACQLA